MTATAVPLTWYDRAVLLEPSKTLVLADVHLGRGAESRVEAPLDRVGDTLERFEHLLERAAPETVVVAGDLLHAFDRVPPGVRADARTLAAAVAEAGASLVVTPGNHDGHLETVLEGDHHSTHTTSGDVLITHGHEDPHDVGRLTVVGHHHPAIRIEGRKRPCFLYGESVYRGSDVLALPAFSRLARGTSVHRLPRSGSCPPPIRRAGQLQPVVVDGDPLWFPPLAECAHLL